MRYSKPFIFLLIVIAALLFFRLGSWGVTETSEARYAEISRAMYESGDLIHPELLGIHHYHKPPFTYAITALSYSIFGVTPFASRFFLVIFFLIQLVCVYQLTYLLFKKNEKLSLLACLIYCSLPLTVVATRNLTTDVYLTTFVLLSCVTWVTYRQKSKQIYLYLFGLFMALGFLTKGPVIFIVPPVFVLAYNYSFPSKQKLSIHNLLALLLFLSVAMSWFIILIQENYNFLSYFLGTHTVDRIATNRFDRGEPFYYYLIYGTLTALPWVVILISQLFTKYKKLNRTNSPEFVLAISILIPTLILSSVSSKLVFYIAPIFGFIAILTAKVVTDFSPKGQANTCKFIVGFSFFLLAALVVGPFLQIKDISIAKQIIFIPLLAIGLLVFILRYKHLNSPFKAAISSAISLFAIVIYSTFFFSSNELEINATKPIATYLQENKLNDKKIVVYDKVLPSLAFHLQQKPIFIYDGNSSLQRETQFETNENWTNYLYDAKSEQEVKRFNKLNENELVLLYRNRNELSPFLQDRVDNFNQEEQIGDWIILFNKKD